MPVGSSAPVSVLASNSRSDGARRNGGRWRTMATCQRQTKARNGQRAPHALVVDATPTDDREFETKPPLGRHKFITPSVYPEGRATVIAVSLSSFIKIYKCCGSRTKKMFSPFSSKHPHTTQQSKYDKDLSEQVMLLRLICN